MRNLLFGAVLALCATGAVAETRAAQPPAAVAPAAGALDGDWSGALDVGGRALRIVFHVVTADGRTTATLDSPDQGAFGLPVSGVSLDGRAAGFILTAPPASFSGELAADGRSIVGAWRQGGAALPLTLSLAAPGSLAAAPKRPQTPAKPYPYRAEEVGYDNPAGGAHLAGTLTLPPGPGPFPAVLLITGSGAEDRDETVFGHKPFLILADYLTRRGIAVLRVDDRGIGGSTGDLADATSEDFAGDAAAGVAFLKGRREIDPRRIGLIGHSEGGIIAPMVAAKDPAVAFLVLLAGSAVPGDQIVLEQVRLLNQAAGAGPEQTARNVAFEREILVAVRSAPDAATARERATALLTGAGVPEARAKAQGEQLGSPWFRWFLGYDPAPALAKLKIPVLALNGSKDLQVPAAQNLPAIRRALAGDPAATVVELPGLNHLFQTAETGAPDEYVRIEETLSPAALAAVGDWIAARTRGDQPSRSGASQ